MNREEQIEQASMKTFPLPILYNEEQQKSKEYVEVWRIAKNNQFGFVRGALWADEHPRKGLVDIDKACEWLKRNYIEIGLHFIRGYEEKDDVEAFRKYMEEQQ